jgi:PAS domain S-box-containing protein
MKQVRYIRPFWRWAVPALTFTVGTSLSVFAFFEARHVDETQIHSAIELRTQWRTSDFHIKISDAAVPIEALSVSIASNPNLGSAEFHRLATQARGEDPIARLGWWPRIDKGSRAAFEQAARADSSDFTIRQRDAAGAFVPADDREEYLPLRFEERFGKLDSLLGFDMASDVTRRESSGRARDEGVGIASGLLPATPQDSAARYTIYWPVYRGGGVPATTAERREKLLGFVSGLMYTDAVFSFAIRDTPKVVEQLSLYLDQKPEAPLGKPAALYLPDADRVITGAMAPGDANPDGLRSVRSFQEFGREWVLVFDYPPEILRDLSSTARWGYLLLGMALTLLIAGDELLQHRRRVDCEVLVASRTRDLRRASEQLDAIIEASPFAIGCVDPQGHVTLWNHTAEQVFGYSAEEAIGRLYPVIPEGEMETFTHRLASIAQGEIVRGIEARRQRKDGKTIDVRFSAAPFRDSTGDLLGIVFAVEDITERNEVQRQLIRAQKMETVGQLTGGLAHDFNNILGAVIGNLDLAEENVAPASPAATYCKAALDAALSAAELVKRLLAFSRRQPLRPEQVDLSGVINNVLPLVKRTLGEHVRVEAKQAFDCWPAVADSVQLESAILNLAINARDAMPDGGVVRIDAANVNVDEAFARASGDLAIGDYATLSVTDTGTGMTPDVLAHVFEPFYTTKPPGEGSGLGLSMVFGTMKQLGGTVKIYSEVGVGTTVRLFLPRALAVGQAAPRPPPVEDEPMAGGKEHILLVEDNAQIREVGADILRKLGYRVTLAESGDDAMQRIDNGTQFDMLFSDIVMAGQLNGIALAVKLRGRDGKIPILLTSGFTSPGVMRENVADLGAELILKPYRRADLARVVRKMLDRGGSSAV